jgi:hypothetical protein
MPTAIDQPADAMPTVHMGWVNPPADVTNAIEGLRQHCEAWPKTPIENPLHLVSGTADAFCQAVTGHALFVPGDLAESIFRLGTLMVAAFIVLVVVIAGAVGFSIRQWAKHFPPRTPKAAKPPPDVLTSVVVVIGWFGWLSAAGLATRYSLGGATAFMAAMLMWIFVAPHLVSLLRNKNA